LFEIVLARKRGSLTLQARAHLDDGTVRESVRVPLADVRHLIEVAWRRSRRPATSDGQLQLRLDGADAATVADLQNEAGGVDYVELGLVAEETLPGRSIRRTVFLDAFESWRPR